MLKGLVLVQKNLWLLLLFILGTGLVAHVLKAVFGAQRGRLLQLVFSFLTLQQLVEDLGIMIHRLVRAC